MIPATTSQISSGVYRDVRFKIHHPHESYKFCAYIYLYPRWCESKEFGDSLVLTDGCRNWFSGYTMLLCDSPIHGGVTFYRQHLRAPGEIYVELGWNYNHLDDGGESLHDILCDVKQAIDWLHDNYAYGRQYAEVEG